ncbi:enoyl-CoA hydratase [uncultured Photobacterium sp.]|uniref:enoyl-CoA hydratase n=1 Tax=uncultured Photobacterium sp. TaxID=173973 RepID=UPI00262FEFD1|nr:enoyl-CoA hydratase [uncultured Photobacterium sp.]
MSIFRRKILDFIQEIGTIMYVGGILSHIVIGAVLGHSDASTAYHVSIYKEMSAYILILPGLLLKIISDTILFFQFEIKPNWLKVKLLMTAFLSINAFVFLVPMMPELVELAKQSLQQGSAVSQAFIYKSKLEQLVGMSNVIPLLLELILGAFKPALGKERK